MIKLLTALCKLRAGIITYNLSVGTENTASSGYPETLTLFWIEPDLQAVDLVKG